MIRIKGGDDSIIGAFDPLEVLCVTAGKVVASEPVSVPVTITFRGGAQVTLTVDHPDQIEKLVDLIETAKEEISA
jgi:hypothetical protein